LHVAVVSAIVSLAQKEAPTAHKSDFDRLLEAIDYLGDRIVSHLDRIARDLEAHPAPRNHLGAYVSAVYGRRVPVSPVNIVVPKLLDTEKVLLSVMPRKADGHVDREALVTWESDDPSKVGVEPGTGTFDFTDDQNGGEVVTCPGFFNCFATTPLSDEESATVTVSAKGYDPAMFAISYAPGQPRSLNASYGQPVSDL
jgi:hypothetical protein